MSLEIFFYLFYQPEKLQSICNKNYQLFKTGNLLSMIIIYIFLVYFVQTLQYNEQFKYNLCLNYTLLKPLYLFYVFMLVHSCDYDITNTLYCLYVPPCLPGGK